MATQSMQHTCSERGNNCVEVIGGCSQVCVGSAVVTKKQICADLSEHLHIDAADAFAQSSDRTRQLSRWVLS